MLVLDEIPVKAWITEYKRQLVLLAGARLLEGLLVLLAARELSCIVSGIFLEHSSISEAAPHFGVLLFAMLAKNLDILQQKDLCSRLSHQFRARLRTKIHAALLLEKDASPRGSRQRHWKA